MNKYVKLLSALRRADDKLAEVVKDISREVLEQYHLHGNKTPYFQLQVALNGGTDDWGIFGKRGDKVRGLSAGVCRLFAGLKLGKRDEFADIEALATASADKGMQTRADAKADAQAKREAKAKADAKGSAAVKVASCLIDEQGRVVKLTADELAAILETLGHLRSADAPVANSGLVIEMAQ